MRSQQRQIEELLAGEGWRVAERASQPDWWLDEVWIIESEWSPVGDRAYVSFLVHPMAPIEPPSGLLVGGPRGQDQRDLVVTKGRQNPLIGLDVLGRLSRAHGCLLRRGELQTNGLARGDLDSLFS